jgi:hypothetical protein
MTRPATVFVYAVVAMVVAHLIYAATGLAANPDFSVGDDATAVKWLGIDYNGWHAVAGFALFGPGLLLLRWPQFARIWVWWTAFLLVVTAVWGLLDTRPLGVLFLPDSRTDAMFHVGSALAFLALLPLDKRQSVTA